MDTLAKILYEIDQGKGINEAARAGGLNRGMVAAAYKGYQIGKVASLSAPEQAGNQDKDKEPEPGTLIILWGWAVYFYKKIRRWRRR